MLKAVFLDRDGVINKEKNYLHRIKDFEFIEGVFEACRSFQMNDYILLIITNQSGIGRGYYTHKEYDRLTAYMLKEFKNTGVLISKVYYCPHKPEDDCQCRKPRIGMIKEALDDFNIDLKKSWLIGDKEVDVETAINAEIRNKILVRSGHKIDEEKSKADLIIDSIAEAVDLIK